MFKKGTCKFGIKVIMTLTPLKIYYYDTKNSNFELARDQHTTTEGVNGSTYHLPPTTMPTFIEAINEFITLVNE